MDANDDRISAWHRVAAHPFFEDAFREESPLIEAMIRRLDGLMTKKESDTATRAEEPADWRVLRAYSNGFVDGLRRGVEGRLDH